MICVDDSNKFQLSWTLLYLVRESLSIDTVCSMKYSFLNQRKFGRPVSVAVRSLTGINLPNFNIIPVNVACPAFLQASVHGMVRRGNNDHASVVPG